MSTVNFSRPTAPQQPFVVPAQPSTSQLSNGAPSATSSGSTNEPRSNESTSGYVPRPKRIACMVCRRRKLRCDGKKPNCGNCARLGHDCAYNEVRKKSGPKRGYVKQLEARLAQVETLLKGQDAPDGVQNADSMQDARPDPVHNAFTTEPSLRTPPSSSTNPEPSITLGTFMDLPSNPAGLTEPSLASRDEFSWEMISMGLEEPLPVQEVIDELNEIYFQKIHPSCPMIHKPRYYAAMNLSPPMRPPVCLRYMMWALAAATTDRYQSLHPHFYNRARKYAELDEMKSLGESMVTVAHAQCWCLIATYEYKMMYFPRAWMSTGRVMRLALMMGLHRHDGLGLDVKQCLPPPRDWTEREERRRTFWLAFTQDRYASIGTGWPMMLDERDILTYLPASDEAFLNCRAEKSVSLSDALFGQGVSTLSSFGAVVVLTCHLGRNLNHLHRPSTNDNDHDLNGEFWKRHRALDNIVLNTSLSLPSHLRLPEGLGEPSVVFCNMCIHTSTICLHQAAIFKAEKNEMPHQIAAESKRRCIVAADQITNIMKMISHLDLTGFHPFVVFCLYVAARVFVQYLKSRPDDLTVRSSLQFLISAMNALKSKNPLSHSFLVQLEFDLENSNLGIFTAGCPGVAQNNETGQIDLIPDGGSSGKRIPHPCGDKPGGPYSNAGFLPPTSLPSHPKPAPQPRKQQPPTQSTHYSIPTDIHMLSSAADLSFSPLVDDRIRTFVMEMDVSTDMSASSDRQPSGSDHSTPITHHTSNSSSSPHNVDQPSPPNQNQNQHQSSQTRGGFLPTPSPNLDTNSISTNMSSFPNTTNPSTTNPFTFPASWNYTPQQEQSQPQRGSAVPLTSTPSASIDLSSFDLNWSNVAGEQDWNNWQS